MAALSRWKSLQLKHFCFFCTESKKSNSVRCIAEYFSALASNHFYSTLLTPCELELLFFPLSLQSELKASYRQNLVQEGDKSLLNSLPPMGTLNLLHNSRLIDQWNKQRAYKETHRYMFNWYDKGPKNVPWWNDSL